MPEDLGQRMEGTETAGPSVRPARPGDRDLILRAFAQADRAAGSDHPGSEAMAAAPDLPAGTFPGYDLVREVHRGGQGVVYKAVQRSTHRVVALKLMHGGPGLGSSGRARFEREVHVLGQLNHPGIVKVHDSGSTPDGGLFYVMDFVGGKPLDTLIREWRTEAERSRARSSSGVGRAAARSSVLAGGELRARLEMFAKICEGVNAAHLKGVIHRDLKPANIRLDANGEPVVVDFGLAKVAAADFPTGRGGEMTTTGQFIGSMPWSSPEQAEGLHDAVDTRSDVYSLGVILYQIVTGGRFPYPVAGTMREVMHHIAHTEPERPGLIDRGVNDEVETIVLKALAKERERRYQTAGELARDVRRYLGGEPIEAKRDSGWYLLTKTIRRNRVPAGFIGALAVLTLGFTVALAAKYAEANGLRHEAERREQAAVLARDQADAERSRAEANFEAVRDLARVFMFEFHDEIENLRGATRARGLVVEQAAAYLARLQRQVDAEAVPRPGLLRDLAQAYDRLGDLQAGFAEANEGDSDEAEASYAAAEAIRAALLENDPGNAEVWLDAGRGAVARGRLEQRRGEFERALASGQEALAAFDRAADLGADEVEAGRARADAFVLLADLHHRLARAQDDRVSAEAQIDASVEWIGRAEAWWAADPGGDGGDPAMSLAALISKRGRAAGERALWAHRAAGEDPQGRARALAEATRFAEEARSLNAQASAAYEARRVERPADRDALHGLVLSRMEEGLAMDTLAGLAEARGEGPDAVAALRDGAMAVHQRALDEAQALARDLSDLEAQRVLGAAMNKVGNSLRELGRLDEAELLYEELVAHRRGVYAADPVARHLRDLALVVGKRAQIDQLQAARAEGEARRERLESALAGYRESLGLFGELEARGVPMAREIGVTSRVIAAVERSLQDEGD